VSDTDRDPLPSEHREYLRKAIEEAVTKLPDQVAELDEAIRPFDSFDLIAWIGLRNLLFDPNRYAESTHPGRMVDVEYIALLAASSPYHPSTRPLPSPAEQQRISDLVGQIMATSMIRMMQHDPAFRGQPTTALDDSAHVQRLYEMFVRVPGYPHHQRHLLHGLFTPFDDSIRHLLGFTVTDALQVFARIHSRMGAVIRARSDLMSKQASSIRHKIRDLRRGKPSDEAVEIPEEWVRYLSKLSDKELTEHSRQVVQALMFVEIGRSLSFTPAELLEHQDSIASDALRAYLSAFSIPFGTVDKKFRTPEPIHPLKTRPILEHETRYLCPVPDLLLWAIQPTLETALKSDSRIWSRYERHRHDFVLGEAVRLLHEIMPTSQFATHLKYKVVEAGQQKEVELDALGSYDTAIFLLEAKAGGLQQAARKGVPAPLRDQVSDLVHAAHSQALRAEQYLRTSSNPVFTPGRGKPIVLAPHTAKRARIYLVSVILEPLGHLTAKMRLDSPFVADPQKPSWAVSVLDLYAIADCLKGYPAWLPHYIERRTRVFGQPWLVTGDELDLFLMYLAKGLYYENAAEVGLVDGKTPDEVLFTGYQDKLDAYYLRASGARSRAAPKPQPAMDPAFRVLIDRLDASGLSGRLDGELALLDMGGESRRGFLDNIQKTRRRASRDGKPHDFHVIGGIPGVDRWGLVYACAASSSEREAKFRSYCAQKRAETRARRWVLIAETERKRAFWLVIREDAP